MAYRIRSAREARRATFFRRMIFACTPRVVERDADILTRKPVMPFRLAAE